MVSVAGYYVIAVFNILKDLDLALSFVSAGTNEIKKLQLVYKSPIQSMSSCAMSFFPKLSEILIIISFPPPSEANQTPR